MFVRYAESLLSHFHFGAWEYILPLSGPLPGVTSAAGINSERTTVLH